MKAGKRKTVGQHVTAYHMFLKEKKRELHGQVNDMQQLSSVVAGQWRLLNSVQKQPYIESAKAEVSRRRASKTSMYDNLSVIADPAKRERVFSGRRLRIEHKLQAMCKETAADAVLLVRSGDSHNIFSWSSESLRQQAAEFAAILRSQSSILFSHNGVPNHPPGRAASHANTAVGSVSIAPVDNSRQSQTSALSLEARSPVHEPAILVRPIALSAGTMATEPSTVCAATAQAAASDSGSVNRASAVQQPVAPLEAGLDHVGFQVPSAAPRFLFTFPSGVVRGSN
eukprot:GILK01012568.1.p1 GENE.GILK01012568.1~~GILK01012568.1.p1  ORF type:complete len:291 (-),score=21.61 GILK01012568.1:28-879(-)